MFDIDNDNIFEIEMRKIENGHLDNNYISNKHNQHQQHLQLESFEKQMTKKTVI